MKTILLTTFIAATVFFALAAEAGNGLFMAFSLGVLILSVLAMLNYSSHERIS